MEAFLPLLIIIAFLVYFFVAIWLCLVLDRLYREEHRFVITWNGMSSDLAVPSLKKFLMVSDIACVLGFAWTVFLMLYWFHAENLIYLLFMFYFFLVAFLIGANKWNFSIISIFEDSEIDSKTCFWLQFTGVIGLIVGYWLLIVNTSYGMIDKSFKRCEFEKELLVTHVGVSGGGSRGHSHSYFATVNSDTKKYAQEITTVKPKLPLFTQWIADVIADLPGANFCDCMDYSSFDYLQDDIEEAEYDAAEENKSKLRERFTIGYYGNVIMHKKIGTLIK